MTPTKESNSPILFKEIARSYTQGANILFESEFAGVHRFNWDFGLLFHPLSQLYGVAIETAFKGILVCRGKSFKRSHDLEALHNQLEDQNLEDDLKYDLSGIEVPNDIRDSNPNTPIDELEEFYRSPGFHVHLLNLVYNKPYATRYPVIGGHSLPDPFALKAISHRLVLVLHDECRDWKKP